MRTRIDCPYRARYQYRRTSNTCQPPRTLKNIHPWLRLYVENFLMAFCDKKRVTSMRL
jgi:hypothetical protein